MAYKSLFEGVIFIEGAEHSGRVLGNVEYKKDSFYNNQLKNLSNVKAQLAEKAKKLGANTIANFKYGQKNTSLFRSMLLALDDNVNWYGSGTAIRLDENKYAEYVEQIQSRN